MTNEIVCDILYGKKFQNYFVYNKFHICCYFTTKETKKKIDVIILIL